MRLTLITLTIALLVAVALAAQLTACGPKTHWFPTCNEPGSNCPPVTPGEDPVPYPQGPSFDYSKATDARLDADAR